MAYLTNILIAIDQLVNTLIGGEPDESLSSHAYRLDQLGKPFGFTRRVIDAIFLVLIWRRGHCQESYEAEIERRQLPPSLRGVARK